MALSMLAGCSSSSTTEEPVITTTTNTGVVSYVQSNMDADDVGKYQAAVTLSGNETADEASFIKLVKAVDGDLTQVAMNIEKVEKLTGLSTLFGTDGQAQTSKTKPYMVAVPKAKNTNTNYSDSDLGKAILAMMKNRNSTGKGSYQKIASISVFDVTVSAPNTTANVVVNGSSVDLTETTEYWAVVINLAGEDTSNDNTTTTNGK